MKKYLSKKLLLPVLLLALIVPVAIIAVGCGGSSSLDASLFNGRWVSGEGEDRVMNTFAGTTNANRTLTTYNFYDSEIEEMTWRVAGRNLVMYYDGEEDGRFRVTFSNSNNTMTIAMPVELGGDMAFTRVTEVSVNNLMFQEQREPSRAFYAVGSEAQTGHTDETLGFFGTQASGAVTFSGSTATVNVSEYASQVAVNVRNLFGAAMNMENTSNWRIRVAGTTPGNWVDLTMRAPGETGATSVWVYDVNSNGWIGGEGTHMPAYIVIGTAETRTIEFNFEYNGIPHTFFVNTVVPTTVA
ncbi:MAG: hypothetical protein FWE01_02905 [Firmicutes bacterium]|nr:hypothetical protein [Bacillota bacterium]